VFYFAIYGNEKRNPRSLISGMNPEFSDLFPSEKVGNLSGAINSRYRAITNCFVFRAAIQLPLNGESTTTHMRGLLLYTCAVYYCTHALAALHIFVISFPRLRHGQSHPAHSYRIKPGFSFDVSGFLQPTGWFISSGITNNRLTVRHLPLNVGKPDHWSDFCCGR
jgi:hypothetical protein